MVNSGVIYAASIASLGNNGGTVLTLPDTSCQYWEFRISAKYAAVAATTGIQVAIQTSPDNSTYTNYNLGATVPKLSTGTNLGSLVFRVVAGGQEFGQTSPPVFNFVKVTLTNTDTANAAIVVLDYYGHKE